MAIVVNVNGPGTDSPNQNLNLNDSRSNKINGLLSQHLIFSNAAILHCVDIDDIMYCESVNRMVSIYGAQFEHRNIANLRLGDLYKLLPSDRFIRVGRSHILNRHSITCLDKREARCWLAWRGQTREVQLYARNVKILEESLL
ncbi:LytTR family DNA-binding domain-containing protein [Dyadobacter fanqingshengii]|uniref:LytTR family DNA-binding domain-containing protein n=1 Tax=Dyadobacter fanqingshengii TaxID=2906443 RepID=UPI0035B67CD7